MSVHLAGKLPKDDKNGLYRLEGREPAAKMVVAVIVPSKRVEDFDHPEDDQQDHYRVSHIEIIDGPDADQARMMLARCYEARTGVKPLDLV